MSQSTHLFQLHSPALRHWGLGFFVLLLGLSASFVGSAQTSGTGTGTTTTIAQTDPLCDAAIGQQIQQIAAARAHQNLEIDNQIQKLYLKPTPSNLTSCVGDYFPKLNFSMPSMNTLLQNAENYLKSQACAIVNNELSQAESPLLSLNQWQSINIPGMNVGGNQLGGGSIGNIGGGVSAGPMPKPGSSVGNPLQGILH